MGRFSVVGFRLSVAGCRLPVVSRRSVVHPGARAASMECAGRAQRRRRFGFRSSPQSVGCPSSVAGCRRRTRLAAATPVRSQTGLARDRPDYQKRTRIPSLDLLGNPLARIAHELRRVRSEGRGARSEEQGGRTRGRSPFATRPAVGEPLHCRLWAGEACGLRGVGVPEPQAQAPRYSRFCP